jgi:recombination protein RecA
LGGLIGFGKGGGIIMAIKSEKGKSIDLAISQIEKQYGRGSIMKMGQDGAIIDIPVISTGSLALDAALGLGGVPRGRVIEIFGPEASGKTTLALHIIAEAQAKDGIAAFIDAEHALDLAYARKLGVNIDDLLVSQPDTGEQALDIAEILVRSDSQINDMCCLYKSDQNEDRGVVWQPGDYHWRKCTQILCHPTP